MKNFNVLLMKLMKRNLQSLNAVSPIIATLMLVLIVVGAAASFAVFTGQQQARLQDQQEANQLMELELIDINRIVDINYNSSGYLRNITFQIKVLHQFDSEIRQVTLNGEPMNFFYVKNQTSDFECYYDTNYINQGFQYLHWDNGTNPLTFEANKIYYIMINCNIDPYNVYYGDDPDEIPISCNMPMDIDENEDYISLEIYTEHRKYHIKEFIPPNPIGIMELQPQYNGSGYEDSISLDGTRSEAITENSYIVEYNWTVNYSKFDSFYFFDLNNNSQYDDNGSDYNISDSQQNYTASIDYNHNNGSNDVSFLWEDTNNSGTFNESEFRENLTAFPIIINSLEADKNYSKLEYDNESFYMTYYLKSKTMIPPVISRNINEIFLTVADNQGMKSTIQVYP